MPINQWTLRATEDRQAKMERLRKLLHNRIDGERVHGVLTTAQILDWALECLEKETSQHEKLTQE